MTIESVTIDPIGGQIEVYRKHSVKVGESTHDQVHLEQYFLDNQSVEPCSDGLRVKGSFRGGTKIIITHDALDAPIEHTMRDERVIAASLAAEIAAQLNQADETLKAAESYQDSADVLVTVGGTVSVVLENHAEDPVPADVMEVIKAHS